MPHTTARLRLTTNRKILLSIAVLALAFGVITLGSYATFTDSTTATPTVHSGLVDFNLSVPGVDNRLNVAAVNMLPGDTMQRRVKITNVGNLDMAWITLTTTATVSSILNTDTTNGLQLKINRCAGTIGWTPSGPPYTYTCDQTALHDNAGTRPAVLATRPIIGTSMALTGMHVLSRGGVDDLLVTVSFPAWNANSWAHKTSRILYTFDSVQA